MNSDESLMNLLHRVRLLNKEENLREIFELLDNELLQKYDSAELYVERAIAYRKRELFSFSIKDCTAALNINPGYTSAYFEKILAMVERKDYQGAIDFYNQVRISGFDNDLLAATSDYQKAISPSESEFLRKKLSEAYFKKAFNLYQNGKHVDAIDNFTLAIDFNGAFDEAFYWRAIVNKIVSRYEQAISDFEKCLSLNPNKRIVNSLIKYIKYSTAKTRAINTEKLTIFVLDHLPRAYGYSKCDWNEYDKLMVYVSDNPVTLLSNLKTYSPAILFAHNHTRKQDYEQVQILTKETRKLFPECFIIITFWEGSYEQRINTINKEYEFDMLMEIVDSQDFFTQLQKSEISQFNYTTRQKILRMSLEFSKNNIPEAFFDSDL